MNKLKHLFLLPFIIAILCIGAIKANAIAADEGVTTNLIVHSDNGIFTTNASYTFEVKNTYRTSQEGMVSYTVTTPAGKLVARDSVEARIAGNSRKHYNFDIPAMKPGFYKINFMINVSDYDDTTKRVFGIRPEEIRSNHPRPADFNSFWQTTRAELAAVKPNYIVTEKPEMAKDNRRVFLIEMKSLDDITVRAWLTIPKGKRKNHKFPVLVTLPGYQATLKPMFGVDEDMAMLAINVRGQGNSRDVIHSTREDYIILNIGDKNKYVMRGAVMDCVRAIDFVYSRPDLDTSRIEISGGSMGGFLSIALAGVDNRIKLASAQNPIMCDIRNLEGVANWPIYDIKNYVKDKPGMSFAKVMDNLDYFDIKNFAPNIRIPIIVGIGLLDHLAPPENEFAFYNNLASKQRIIRVHKDLGHEVPRSFMNEDGHRMRDMFGLF